MQHETSINLILISDIGRLYKFNKKIKLNNTNNIIIKTILLQILQNSNTYARARFNYYTQQRPSESQFKFMSARVT